MQKGTSKFRTSPAALRRRWELAPGTTADDPPSIITSTSQTLRFLRSPCLGHDRQPPRPPLESWSPRLLVGAWPDQQPDQRRRRWRRGFGEWSRAARRWRRGRWGVERAAAVEEGV